jgi:hypothetical protein
MLGVVSGTLNLPSSPEHRVILEALTASQARQTRLTLLCPLQCYSSRTDPQRHHPAEYRMMDRCNNNVATIPRTEMTLIITYGSTMRILGVSQISQSAVHLKTGPRTSGPRNHSLRSLARPFPMRQCKFADLAKRKQAWSQRI